MKQQRRGGGAWRWSQPAALALVLAPVGILAQDRPAAGAPAPPPAGVAEVPAEYRGTAAPLEATETASELRRAEEHFAAGAWEAGLGVAQDLLNRATAPAPKRRTPIPRPAEEKKDEQPGQPGIRRFVIFNRSGERLDDAEEEPEPELTIAEEVASRDGIRLGPLAPWLARRLAELPPEARDFYRRAYEPAARADLEKARALPAARAARELRAVGERYPLCAAGLEARELAADLLLDAGRPLEAARGYDACLDLPGDPGTSRATLLAKAAVALALARLPAPAAAHLDEIAGRHSETIIHVGGEAVPGHRLLAHPVVVSLLEQARAAAPPPQGWLGAGGSHARAALPAAPGAAAQLGSRGRWVLPLLPEGLRQQETGPRRTPAAPPCPAAAVDGLLLVRLGNEIIALDAASGKRRWHSDLAELRGSAAAAQRSGYHTFDSFDVARLAQGLSIVPAEGQRSPLIVACEGQLQAGQTQSGKVVYRPNRLVALNARTGKLAWLVGGEDEDASPPASGSRGSSRRFAFAGPPVWTGGLLVAPALRGEGFYLLGLSREGKVRWTRRLYTMGAGQIERYGYSFSPAAQIAGRDGIVGVAAGHGLAAAVDAASGEVLWLSRYRSGLRGAGFGRTWTAGGPILTANRLIAAPVDSDHLVAFDLRTGRIAWEKAFAGGPVRALLGASDQAVYVGDNAVQALRLSDGGDLWTSEQIAGARPEGQSWNPYYGYASSWGAGVDAGVVLEDLVVGLAHDGHLAALDVASGKTLGKVRLFDPRLARSETASLLLAGGAFFGVTGTRIFRLEPQSSSWDDVGGGGDAKLYERTRLLRAEGRHEEAIAALDVLCSRLRSRELREEVETEIVEAARAAAASTGDPRFIAELLGREKKIVRDRAFALTLRLLEASLHEKGGRGTSLEAAARIYLELSRLDGLEATSPDGFEVDVGAHAADALRQLRSRGQQVDDPAGEEQTRARLGASGRTLEKAESFVLLRRAHLLESAAGLHERLVQAAAGDGDGPRELDAIRLSLHDRPAPPGTADARHARQQELAAAGSGEAPQPGLKELLDAAGGKPLSRLSWHNAEDGFLAGGEAGSAPLPGLLAIAGSAVRLYGKDGRTLYQRELPDYPDIADTKLMLQAHVEEPASVHARAGDMVLLTAAGIYCFRGAPADGGGLQAKGIKLLWAHTWPHPLVEMGQSRRGGWFWGGMALPEGQNVFAEGVTLPGGDPAVLEPHGGLLILDRRNGKLQLKASCPEGRPASAPAVSGPWLVTRTASPAGLWLERLPGSARKRGAASRTIHAAGRAPLAARGEPQGAVLGPVQQVALGAAHRAAVFQGSVVEVQEIASGRRLWRTTGAGARLAFVAGGSVWLSEEGRLVQRSIRSGREESSLPLPDGTSVVGVFPEADGGRTLALSRGIRSLNRWYYNEERASTGTDLHLLRIGPAGEQRWLEQLHSGPVTFRPNRSLAADGRFILAFNGEGKDEKWYTRVVQVRPEDGSHTELCSAEVHGKGTGQAPRVLVLDGGLGIGNADGFGWFAAEQPGAPGEGGLGPAPPVHEQQKGN